MNKTHTCLPQSRRMALFYYLFYSKPQTQIIIGVKRISNIVPVAWRFLLIHGIIEENNSDKEYLHTSIATAFYV